MRNSILTEGVLFGVSLALILSCAPKKRMVSAGGEERRVSRSERLTVLRQVNEQQAHFTTFSGRAKSHIVINRDSYDVTAHVRIEHDKAIWISITALMGMEAGRVLITPDSIQVMNRLKSEYVKQPFDYLHHFTSDQLDFAGLQQLLVGNVIRGVVGDGTEVLAILGGYVLRGETDALRYGIQMDSDYRTLVTTLDEVARRQRIEATYANFRPLAEQSFPHRVGILLDAEGLTLRSEMNYNRITYNEPVDMPFQVPAKYTEVY